MAVRDDRSDVKQTTTGFRGPLMVQSLTSAKSKFLSLGRTVLIENPGGGAKAYAVNYKILVAGHETANKEVLITTEVTDKQRLVFSNSRTYYLNQNDEDNYHKPRNEGFKVVGCSSGEAC